MCALPNEIIHGIFEYMLLDDHHCLPTLKEVSEELSASAWEDVRLTVATRLVQRWRIRQRWAITMCDVDRMKKQEQQDAYVYNLICECLRILNLKP